MGKKPTTILSLEQSSLPQDVRKPLWIDFTEALFMYHMIDYHADKANTEDTQWAITGLYVRSCDSNNSLFMFLSSWDYQITYYLLTKEKIMIDPKYIIQLKRFATGRPELHDNNPNFISLIKECEIQDEVLRRFTKDRDEAEDEKMCWGKFFG